MRNEIAVLVIHGMGSQSPDFADDMIEELNDRVEDLNKDPKSIAWLPIYWADITENRQREYLRNTKRSNDLDYIPLRKFILSALGDASAYQKVQSSKNTTYEKIHERIKRKIRSLYENDLKSQDLPLIILAHSLGGHIMSNYIWDIQKNRDQTLSPFERMESLSGIITFGCNIPLFTFSYEKVEPIEFPPHQLPSHLTKKAQWLNYYDPDDVLGYPLKSINEDYKNTVSEDIAINVGGLLSSWNPMSHSDYWTDNSFTKPTAGFIAGFL